jgi:predicted ThiF/HesA family dinucleotide-utilizing enzyme
VATLIIVEGRTVPATAAVLEEAGLEFETMSAAEGMEGLLRRRPAVAIVDMDEASAKTTTLLAEASGHAQLSAMVVLGISSRSAKPPIFSELRRLINLVVDRTETRRLRDLVLILQGA